MEYVLIDEKIYNTYDDNKRNKKAILADNIFKFINIDNFDKLQTILLQLKEFLLKQENIAVCQNLQNIFIKTLQYIKAPQESYDLVYETFTGENKMTLGQIERLKHNLEKSAEDSFQKGKKESFFDGLFAMIVIKFGSIANNLKEQIIQLNFKSLNLLDYTNLISSSNSAEEAYSKIAKLATS